MAEEEQPHQFLFNATWTWALLLGGTVLAFILLYPRFKSHKGQSLAPGPRGVQALLAMLRAMWEGSFSTQAEAWSRQYGSLVLCRSALGDLCVLNSPRLVRELLAGRETERLTGNRPWSFAGCFVFYGFKDVGVSGPLFRQEWPKMRKLLHQAIRFYGDGVERMESRVQEELRRLVTELEADCGQEVDMDHVISTSVMRIVLTLVTGEHPEASLARVSKRFDAALNKVYDPVVDATLTLCPWLRHIPLLPYRRLCCDIMQARDEMLEGLYAQCKASRVRGRPRGITDVLLDELEKGDNPWMTEDHVRGLLLDTVSAAFLTSSQALKALFLYLAHNPQVVRRLQKDIDRSLGREPRDCKTG